MSYTKRQLIEDAYAELALAGYVFDLTPEDLNMALRRMDSMIATWSARGVYISYPLYSNPDDSDISEDSNIPLKAVDAVICNLAMIIASSFGKQVPPDVRIRGKRGLDMLMVSMPPEVQKPEYLPKGEGTKYLRVTKNPFFPAPKDDPMAVGGNGNLEFLG